VLVCTTRNGGGHPRDVGGGGPRNLCPPDRRFANRQPYQRLAAAARDVQSTIRDSLRVPNCAAEVQTIEFARTKWRRRPDLNRGWRFCRPCKVVGHSVWLRLRSLKVAGFPWCLGVVAPKLLRTSTVHATRPTMAAVGRSTPYCPTPTSLRCSRRSGAALATPWPPPPPSGRPSSPAERSRGSPA
jgi:hypothetical protein